MFFLARRGCFGVMAGRPLTALLAAILALTAPEAVAKKPKLKELKLVTVADFAPFADPEAPNGGLSVEIVQRIMLEAGYATTVSFDKSKHGLSEVEAGNYDATFPYSFTNKRNEQYFYSQAIEMSSMRVFLPRASKFEYEGLESLRHKTLCRPDDFATLKILRDLPRDSEISIIGKRTLRGCLKVMLSGGADMMVLVDAMVWPEAIRMYGDEVHEKIRDSAPLVHSIRYLIVPRSHPHAIDIIQGFDQALISLIRSGELQAIARRHLLTDIIPYHKMPGDKRVPPDSTHPLRRLKIPKE